METRRRTAAIAILVLLAMVAVIAWSLSGSTKATGSRTSVPPTTSATSASARVAKTSGDLMRDIQMGVDDRSITSPIGVAILGQLTSALSAFDQGQSVNGASGLGLIDASIAQGASSGMIAPKEASILTSDVSALASALRVSSIATTTTTTTAPPPPQPGPPKGGHSHGPQSDDG
jgi:hypothetical protein